MALIYEFLRNVRDFSRSKIWDTAKERLDLDRQHYESFFSTAEVISVYGGNTEVGHRDANIILDGNRIEAQKKILAAHTIGFDDSFDELEARCIGYAKAHSLAAGGSGITSSLFDILCQTVIDPQFKPRIPSNASYSSGDVIPAAHFASDMLDFARSKKGASHALLPGEAMALINGAFVHVGHSASLVPKITSIKEVLLSTLVLSLTSGNFGKNNLYLPHNAERSDLNKFLNQIRTELPDGTDQTLEQHSVSYRATPQVIDTFYTSAKNFISELSYLLFKPSANPIVELSESCPISQASFLAPTLAVSGSGLIDSILFNAWASVGRTSFLLSGRLASVPMDAAYDEGSLGLIQFPKLMTSWLESMRRDLMSRPFITGGSTSYGIEDLWTNGLQMNFQLRKGITGLRKILFCEMYVSLVIQSHLGRDEFVKRYPFSPDDTLGDFTQKIDKYFEEAIGKEL